MCSIVFTQFLDLFLCVCEYLACRCVYVPHVHAWGLCRSEGGLQTLGNGVTDGVSHRGGVLGIDPWSSARAIGVLNL